MKRILVPTDFSPVADNALSYAIGIAAKFRSEIYLYHVFSISKVDYQLDVPEEEQPVKKRLEQKMNLAKLKRKEELAREDLTMQTVLEHDNIFSLFKRKTKEHGISLIVMGSKGASGLSKVIFGSTAVVALETSGVAVLVVPPEHSFRSLEHIVLAVDYKEVSERVLLPLQELASTFNSKVTILNVMNSSNINSHRENDLHLEGVETSYCEVPMSKNINETINDFVEKEACDLLCMIRREKGFFESVFKKSITKAQVFNNRIPLLALPET